MTFGPDYPLKAPKITIESQIYHPNVFGSYICASILNTEEGYTPAYTLKGIAIQLLSLFSSERIEQVGGFTKVNVDDFGHRMREVYGEKVSSYCCGRCGFGRNQPLGTESVASGQDLFAETSVEQADLDLEDPPSTSDCVPAQATTNVNKIQQPRLIDRILALPDEILLLIFANLNTKDLLSAAKVCSKTGDVITSYDFIRVRELQCFCLKESFLEAKLGVAVRISRHGRQRTLALEYDLLSQQAFDEFCVRRSIQGLPFEHWLPLPINRRHWRSVRVDVDTSLTKLAQGASITTGGANVRVLYSFMSDVVVKLSNEANAKWGNVIKITLTHASEKAVES